MKTLQDIHIELQVLQIHLAAHITQLRQKYLDRPLTNNPQVQYNVESKLQGMKAAIWNVENNLDNASQAVSALMHLPPQVDEILGLSLMASSVAKTSVDEAG